MTKAVFFSLIIPTKDRASLLKQCIQSALDQSFTDFEIIIVDDGSTDDTALMISKYKDQRIKYFKQAHKERSSARNFGISLAQGQYICFLDDDDLLKSTYLSDFYQVYQNDIYKDYILRTAYAELKETDQKKKHFYKKSIHKHPVNFAAYNMCGVWSLSVPRQYLIEDQFPTDFPHWQDTHLILRLLAKHPFKQLDAHNYIYRRHAASGSRRNLSEEDFSQRAEINVAAIKDLFKHHQDLIAPFVPSDTASFLVAEKYIQYAVHAKTLGYKNLANDLYAKSKASKFDLKLWKHYLLFGINQR